MHGQKSFLVNICYKSALQSIDTHNAVSWIKSVRNLLCENGFADAWFNQGVGDVASFINVFKLTIIMLCRGGVWESALQGSTVMVYIFTAVQKVG